MTEQSLHADQATAADQSGRAYPLTKQRFTGDWSALQRGDVVARDQRLVHRAPLGKKHREGARARLPTLRLVFVPAPYNIYAKYT